LKCHPPFFGHVVAGAKTFEVRTDDRDFREGDVLHLREWGPFPEDGYTGREHRVRVTYLMRGPLLPGKVVMAIQGEVVDRRVADELEKEATTLKTRLVEQGARLRGLLGEIDLLLDGSGVPKVGPEGEEWGRKERIQHVLDVAALSRYTGEGG
jgi:hypothetical protein